MLTFFVVSLFLVISPGPNMALIIDNAARLGKKSSMCNVLGLCTATYVHGTLSILGVSALVLHSNLLFSIIKVLGATYLACMGVKSLKGGVRGLSHRQQIDHQKEDDFPKGKSSTRLIVSYFDGFITQILNPKVSVFYIAAFPKFLENGAGVKQGFWLVSIHSFNIFVWFTILTLFVSIAKVILERPKVKGGISIATGIVLILFSIYILCE